MKKTLKLFAIVAIIIAAMLALTGCKNKKEEAKDPIIGAWKYENGDYIYHFNEDGTGDYSYGNSKMEFTYKKDDKNISITYKGSTAAFETEYKIDGDTLNIIDSFGKDTLYKKQ